jgi:putative hemolysin
MAGIVTLEDLVEEIVGELDDELDTVDIEFEIVDERTTIVDGSVHVDATNNRLGLELPSGEYETIAGLILDRMGHLPQAGEQVHLDSLNLKVLEMQGPRIARVEITRL